MHRVLIAFIVLLLMAVMINVIIPHTALLFYSPGFFNGIVEVTKLLILLYILKIALDVREQTRHS
ncbi:hypothetical protein [Alkalicoccus luteus]|uniref:hypothetical protein n=1 Tax=Alkalicoccus luteus TaxID=1237094 RepID=UPI004033A787